MHTLRTSHILDLRNHARMRNAVPKRHASADHLTPTLSLVRRGSRPPLPAGEGWGEGLSRLPLATSHSSLATPYSLQASKLSSYNLVFPLVRLFSLTAFVLLGSYALHSFGDSLAYFNDTEASSGSMAVGLLDITVTDPEALFLSCTPGGTMADASIDIAHADAGFPVHIVASVASTSGSVDLCEAIQLDVQYLQGSGESPTLVFQGTSTHFAVNDLDDGTLRFIATLDPTKGPFAQGTMCTLNVGFDAWVDGALDGGAGGFHDYEVAPVTFTVSDSSCTDGGDGDCDDPTCCVGDVDIDIINVNEDTTVIDIDTSTNTGGNTIISDSGTNTVISGDASNSITIIGGTQSNIADVDLGCGCDSEPDCDSPCTGEEMSEVKLPSSEEEGSTADEDVATDTPTDTAPTNTTLIDTRIEDIRAGLDERLAGVRGRNANP